MFVLFKITYYNIRTTINTEKARGPETFCPGPHVARWPVVGPRWLGNYLTDIIPKAKGSLRHLALTFISSSILIHNCICN